MNSKINKYIALIIIFLGYSCSDDFLEEKQNFGEYDDSFYQSEERVTWYLNNLYYDFFQSYNSPVLSVVADWSNRSNLTMEMGGIRDLINPTISYMTADEASGYYGTRLENKLKNEPYHRIRDINSLIENIDTKGEELEQEFRDRTKGQAYFLRALQYYDLMRIYGGVPIVTEVQDADPDDESLKIPRASSSEMVAQIVADLDTAAEMLPSTWDGGDYGRFTKGAALAQKARVLLTHASPLYNNNWESADRWNLALQAGLEAEAELSSSGHGLYGSSAKDWEEMFLIDNTFSSEGIITQLMGNGVTESFLNNSWESNIRLSSQGGDGGVAAPKEMIDLFPMADGSEANAENGYDEFLFFLDRDPRFYRTFAFSGRKWAYKEDPEATTWSYRWVDDEGTAYFSDNNQVPSPAYVRKMTNPSASNESGFEYSGTDIYEFRYAELMLIIAEAYAGTGDLNNSLAYIGQVRERVGISSENNYGIGSLTDKYAAFRAVLQERRIELAYEGKRFWDIHRWMLYNDDASANNNTCSKLGLEPLNGQHRTGNYLQYKEVATADDPLAEQRANISVDPDAEDFEEQLMMLASFYEENFMLEDLETPLDNVDGNQVDIEWKQNYYIMGLNTNVLTQNPWLEQTIGWRGISGEEGSFNWKD